MLALVALALAEGPDLDARAYHDRLVDHRSAYVTRIEGFTATMYVVNVDQPDSLSRTRADVLEKTERARGFEPWRDDSTLRDALVQLGEALVLSLDGPFLELLPLLDPPSPFGRKRRQQRMRELSAELGRQMEASLTAFDDEALAFAHRWELEAG